MSPDRARVLLFVAARTSCFTMLAVLVSVLVVLWAAGSSMTGISGAVAAGWLAVHQLPLVVGGTSLGLLPLVPTGLMLWSVARDCAQAVPSNATRADLGWLVGAALSGPLLITAVSLAVAEDAAAELALRPPPTLAAFGCVGGLHLAAAVVGIATRQQPLREQLLAVVPDWVLSGARVAVRAVLRLLVSATAVVLISLLAHWSQLGDTYGAAGNAMGALGLTLLSLAYVPNVAIAAVSMLVGAEVHIGAGALSVFSVAGAPVPALPILAAVPSGPAASWWPVLLLLAAVVGVRSGVDCARSSHDQIRSPWAMLTAAVVSALATAVLGGLAGGAVGSFGRLVPAIATTSLLVFAWVAAAGYVSLVVARRFLPAIRPAVGYGGVSAAGGAARREFGARADGYAAADGEYDSPVYGGAEYEGIGYDDWGPDDVEYDDRDDEVGYDGDIDSGGADYGDTDRMDTEYGVAEDEPVYDSRATGSDRHGRSGVARAGSGVDEPDIVDGELLDEHDASGTDSAGVDPEILDAEVVEADLPETGDTGGR